MARTKKVNLALQGGGAYGAFTWGVLDEILRDGRLAVEGVSGASAGAVNAVLLADGLAEGRGPEAARERLARFWRNASRDGNLPPLQRAVLDRLMAAADVPSQSPFAPLDPVAFWTRVWQQTFSPYDLNPFDINPLRTLIEDHVDFARLRRFSAMQVYVSATNVRTGKLAVFTRDHLSCAAVMASACLPTLFKAVDIGSEAYWDGGYMGNPPIFPLYRTTTTEDVIIVQLNPVRREVVPTSASGILDRLNEVTFNSPLQSELRAIKFTSRLIETGALRRGREEGSYKAIKVHRITLDGALPAMPKGQKTNTDYEFLLSLRDAGILAARRFLEASFDQINVESTLDLEAETLAEWPSLPDPG